MTAQAPTQGAQSHPLGDLGRRLAQRRAEVGLTRTQAALRAGMAPSYLRYLEERPGAAPDAGVLLRLAGALDTTLSELTGGASDLPPGIGQASPHAEFTELTERECRELLSTHGVGRIAVNTWEGPAVVPVNYAVFDGAIVYRTAPGSTPALAVGRRVAFQTDHIDEAFSRGWSVLVRGDAAAVADPAVARLLDERAYSLPWAGRGRDLWVRVEPRLVTGRRIMT
ncbi:pyridoxamine 5'-phosphate oxidase family protein [Streptomyces sp. B93]|uniref:helix-turn-helix domain-containing protein n=1 Tax=Streptomyces sp. B93 TaxID=2824875 RepID=UPI001B379B88|nr:pyridoxamine 5'-phosphate oxidase family protein [Streptomyces sp. B93]MBQ1088326.1 pyridoxamine 5'-phosphate oxidase family protein [Streptomyces sp. B93]